MANAKGSGYNASVETFRATEFPMLNGSVYLDHAGTTLYSKSLMDGFAKEMTASLFGNPHSASLSSQLSTSRIEDTRLRVLQFFNADPTEFDVIFVANATAGIKLVAEALRAAPGGFNYAYHQSSHTSLVGVREEARNSLCLDDAQMDSWISGSCPFDKSGTRDTTTLFAYPAQSNMDGQRLPLSWSSQLRSLSSSGSSFFTLLDAAALAATAPLDLSDFTTAPDFTVVSFYKIFGFPDLGALIVRRQAEPVFSYRRYFGGGTVDTVVCVKEQWHASKSQFLHERLEDGTLPIHSIIALDVAMESHRRLFGTMRDVASHTAFLTKRLHAGLSELRHRNQQLVCRLYSPDPSQVNPLLGSGPTTSFNILNQTGAWISLAEFEKLATLKQFHIRTGGVCNPGGIATALDLQPWELKRNFSSGFRCGDDNDIIAGKPTGVIRVSLGATSTISDVDNFIAFVQEFYQDDTTSESKETTCRDQKSMSDLYVKSITVYPIKSCGGFQVPKNSGWEVRPEGLAWDREWCLVHRGSGQALSQKRYTRMSLIRPVLDFDKGCLRVTYAGRLPKHLPREISIPLSNNPAMFQSVAPWRSRSSRVCGEEISAQTYVSPEVNDFFSGILEVPCMLARFPPGGQGPSMRHSKAHLQKHQTASRIESIESVTRHAPPSPPDSDVESEKRRILLSNESPILVVNTASLESLNKEIISRGGTDVSASVFRANIVLAPTSDSHQNLAYAEDNWSTLRIGQQDFKMLGSCRRCHMVCINQETGVKNQEPFITLSKTRRFDGKVFFGTHMGHTPNSDMSTREAQHPTIQVGDHAHARF